MEKEELMTQIMNQTTPVERALIALAHVLGTEGLLDDTTLVRHFKQVVHAVCNGDASSSYRYLWEFCAGIGYTQRGEVNKALRALGATLSLQVKVLIEVEGGCVTNIFASEPVEVTLRDFDNIEQGAADPLEDYCKQAEDLTQEELHDVLTQVSPGTNYEAAGYPVTISF